MTVKELCESCANSGVGIIKIYNENNYDDRAKFNDLSELYKTPIKDFKVLTWEFIPKKQIDAISWEFVLEISV